MKCWWTMPMPSAMASCGLVSFAGWPRTTIWPSSGWYSPYRMFISVVLPAPFSPSRARISPWLRVRSMWSLASTPGKRLVTPCSSRMGGISAASKAQGRSFRTPLRVTHWLGLGTLGDGRHVDLAGHQVSLERVQLALRAGRDQAGVVVIGRQAHAVVGQGGVIGGAALERAVGRGLDDGFHGHVHVLQDAGQQHRAGIRHRHALVGIHADGPHLLIGGRGERAVAGQA